MQANRSPAVVLAKKYRLVQPVRLNAASPQSHSPQSTAAWGVDTRPNRGEACAGQFGHVGAGTVPRPIQNSISRLPGPTAPASEQAAGPVTLVGPRSHPSGLSPPAPEPQTRRDQAHGPLPAPSLPGGRRAGPHGVSTDSALRLVLSHWEAPSSLGKRHRCLLWDCGAPALLPAPLHHNPSRQLRA